MATFLLSPPADHTFSSKLSSDVPLTIYGFIYLPFIWGFHNRESWSFVISNRTGTSVPMAFAHVTFVSVLSLWSQTWSPMTTSFASLWIFFFLVENPGLCFLKQTESFQTKNKSLVLNAHCSSSCKTLKDHCAYLSLLEYGCNQLPASSIFSALSLGFCSWMKTLYSASQPCPAAS